MPRKTLSALAVAALAGSASAELPAVMDMIPADSLGGIVAPSLASLDRATMNMFTSVGMPVLTTPSQMVAEAGFVGVDPNRPIAVAFVDGPLDEDEPPLAIFLPSNNHNALMDHFNAKTEDGVQTFRLNGEQMYAKSIGDGYTIVGPVHEAISGYVKVKGQSAAHAKMLGVNGMKAAESSVAWGFVNMPALEPLLADNWDDIREEMSEGMAEGMAQNPMGGGMDIEAAEKAVNEMIDLAQGMVEDGAYGVFGFQVGSMGIGAQLAMDFEPGSESALMFKTRGNSGKLLKALPDQPFIFASAYDLENTAAEKLMDLAKQMQAFSGMGDAGMQGISGLIDGSTGGAGALYPTPAGLMGGVFTGMVNYTRSDNPSKYIKHMQKATEDGGPMNMSLTANEQQLNGNPVHGWTMSFPVDHNNPAAMQMMQMSQMLFGGQQMSGYLVETESGVYQTMSRNLTLVEDAVNGKDTLASSDTIAQVREHLPSPAVAEGYFGFAALYQMLSPMAGMMGIQLQTPVPADLPPIGSSIATGEGGFQAGFFAPAPVLRVGVGLGMEFQAMQGGGGGWEEDEGEAPF